MTPKTVKIPLPFATISEEGWKRWRETDYLQRQKLRNKAGLEFEDFSEPVLCILLSTKKGFIISQTKCGWTIYQPLFDAEWYVPNSVVKKYIKFKSKNN